MSGVTQLGGSTQSNHWCYILLRHLVSHLPLDIPCPSNQDVNTISALDAQSPLQSWYTTSSH